MAGALGRAPHGHSDVRAYMNLTCAASSAALIGSPLHSDHALSSTLFSLLSTYHYPSKFDADIFRSIAVLEGDGGGFSIPPPDIQEIEDS